MPPFASPPDPQSIRITSLKLTALTENEYRVTIDFEFDYDTGAVMGESVERFQIWFDETLAPEGDLRDRIMEIGVQERGDSDVQDSLTTSADVFVMYLQVCT